MYLEACSFPGAPKFSPLRERCRSKLRGVPAGSAFQRFERSLALAKVKQNETDLRGVKTARRALSAALRTS
jgi:hypothetical protein